MVSAPWHDCERMGWVDEDACEPIRCYAVLFPSSGMWNIDECLHRHQFVHAHVHALLCGDFVPPTPCGGISCYGVRYVQARTTGSFASHVSGSNGMYGGSCMANVVFGLHWAAADSAMEQ